MPSSSDNAIFIVGAMRSGTTYLRHLINAHSDIYISPLLASVHPRI